MGDVKTSGPLFDGRAQAAFDRAASDIQHSVAGRAEDAARANFAETIRNDRGVFLDSFKITDISHLYTSTSGKKSYSMPVTVTPGDSVVTTDLATYGPWLEGTGSRNMTTKFRGYNGFRKAAEQVNREATVIGDEVLQSGYIEEMNA